MNEPLIKRPGYEAEELARRFEDMAKRIRLNKDSEFGGAFVLVPPAGFGEPVDSMLINSANASMMFWQHLKSIAENMVKEMQDQTRFR